MSISKKILAFQIVLILMGVDFVFGEPVHISGSNLGQTGSTIAHISGTVHPRVNLPPVKTHISGSEVKVHPQKPVATKSKVLTGSQNVGFTRDASSKSTSLQLSKKTTKNPQKITKIIKGFKSSSLQNQIKHRKACWKACENIWKVGVLKQCSALSGLLHNFCKEDLFKERINCVRKNCRKVTQ